MIGHIEGVVRYSDIDHVLVSVGGVGYKVYATGDTLTALPEGATAALWTYLAVRETALDLYGFPNREELRFFELLLTVSGIGPRSALAVLNIATVETLRAAVAAGDAASLTKVAGIGKKTAEKIVLELREKVGAAVDGETAALGGDTDALEALAALGYSASEAREALKRVPREIADGNERLREALKQLGK